MRRLPFSLRLPILFTLSLCACDQGKTTLDHSKKYDFASSADASETSTTQAPAPTLPQANDRPTETGAGVPGYLIGCGIIKSGDDWVEVACALADKNEQQIKGDPEAWKQYSLELPPENQSGAITVEPRKAEEGLAFDVVFLVKGVNAEGLILLLEKSRVLFEYADDLGRELVVETKKITTVLKTESGEAPLYCTFAQIATAVCNIVDQAK